MFIVCALEVSYIYCVCVRGIPLKLTYAANQTPHPPPYIPELVVKHFLRYQVDKFNLNIEEPIRIHLLFCCIIFIMFGYDCIFICLCVDYYALEHKCHESGIWGFSVP